jgi:hypothetical protein
MAALALHALGESENRVVTYLAEYQQRLRPLDTAPARYCDYLTGYQQQIASEGMTSVIDSELPRYISGWARDAYHPLIRLAYGFEFEIEAEVAAGLAYIRWCEADEAMISLAQSSVPVASAQTAFNSMVDCGVGISRDRNFNTCLELAIAQPAFRAAAVTVPDQLREFSSIALQVFASTHNFFALHLVTGACAYRVLSPFIADHADRYFGLGLLAGYAAVGSPGYDMQAAVETNSTTDWLTSVSRDEHDIKLAHAACSQAIHWGDSRYAQAAATDLRRERS